MCTALEPIVWRPGDRGYDAASAGSVDFDNDEGGTEATIQIVRNPSTRLDAPEYVILIGGDAEKFEIKFCG